MATGTWNVDASGNWSTAANWLSSVIADGATFTANFTNNITATRTVTVDSVRTIGNITLSDNGAAGSAWVIGGANALTLDNGGSAPTLNVITGATISAPILGTSGFTKSGTGELTLNNATPANNTVSGAISVTGGRIYCGPLASGTNSANQLPAVTSAALSASASLWFNHYVGGASTFNVPMTFTGAGWVGISGVASWTGSGVVFSAGQLAGLSGYLYIWTNETYTRSIATVNDLPGSVYFATGVSVAPTSQNTLNLASGFAAGTYNCPIVIEVAGNVSLANWAPSIVANNAGAVVLNGGISRVNLTANANTATFTLSGTNSVDNTVAGAITHVVNQPLAISKTGTNKWILSGANTYTGTTSVSAGTLSARNNTAFGTTGAVTQTGGTIEVTGGTALNKAGAALTLVSAAGANALTSLTGSNTIACAGVTLSSTIIVDIAAGADLTVNNTAAMTGAFGITKNNSGEFGLGTFANTYTGAVTVAAGTLTVGNLQNSGTASSLGTGALSSAIALSGTLKYTGTGHSTNRSITFTGAAPALDASGSGAVTYSAATQAAGARTITFTGSSTAANTLSAALSDGTGAVSIAKSGAGKWVLSNATLNYTGTTTVSDGTLNFGSATRILLGAVSISGGTIENSTNTLSANVTMTGGTITAELTGAKTLDVNSGSAATLSPTNNANTYSGATTVASGGILRLITGVNPTLGGGKVLGIGNVSVTGDIKTSASGLQRGQMRYGGNLTFNAGAKLYVGLA